ncbi:hypothetical protein [Stenotrophomonas sp. 22385]|uniref:hypothetical protein n=1 Tax=Stenotrophomonas sp. 22385 TaxID=3453915 RepID=UPI003F82E09D
MKIKMIGNSILIAATALASAPQVAVAVSPNGQTSVTVMQVSKDVDKTAFVSRLSASFRRMAASDSPETSAAGIQYLEAIERPGIYGLIEQLSYPVVEGGSKVGARAYDAPPQPGSIRVSQWCGQNGGYTYVYQVTEKYMETHPGSQAYGWIQTKSTSTMVTTCPGELA